MNDQQYEQLLREIHRTRVEIRSLKTTVICSVTTGVALLALALAKPRLVVPILVFAVLLLALGVIAAFVGAAAGKTVAGLKERRLKEANKSAQAPGEDARA